VCFGQSLDVTRHLFSSLLTRRLFVCSFTHLFLYISIAFTLRNQSALVRSLKFCRARLTLMCRLLFLIAMAMWMYLNDSALSLCRVREEMNSLTALEIAIGYPSLPRLRVASVSTTNSMLACLPPISSNKQKWAANRNPWILFLYNCWTCTVTAHDCHQCSTLSALPHIRACSHHERYHRIGNILSGSALAFHASTASPSIIPCTYAVPTSW
jgi:hypothetical protein